MTTLPALKSLGELADAVPVIAVDSREQTPLRFQNLPARTTTLQTGDYSVCGLEHLFGIERKSVPDMISCCTNSNRERFERELHRLRGFEFARLLIVGTENEVSESRSRLDPKVVWHTLAAFEVRYCPIVWVLGEVEAAYTVERWAWWYAREQVKRANGLLRGVQNHSSPPPSK